MGKVKRDSSFISDVLTFQRQVHFSITCIFTISFLKSHQLFNAVIYSYILKAENMEPPVKKCFL